MIDNERALDAAKCCLLPALTVKLGDQLITKEHFQEFQSILQDNLRLLLDLLHANEYELLSFDINTFEFKIFLCLVICEQDQETIFQITDLSLQTALKVLSKTVLPKLIKDEKLIQKVLNVYEKKLNTDEWKLNMGSIYGFAEFCERTFCVYTLSDEQINLLLAISLKLLDHFEPDTQLLAFRVFTVLLNEQNITITKALNIHKVVEKEVSQKTAKSNDVKFIIKLWNILYLCSYEASKKDWSKWSSFDNNFEELMSRTGLESEKTQSLIYLCFINMFLADSHENAKVFNPDNFYEVFKYNTVHDYCDNLQNWLQNHKNVDVLNFSCYKWLKKLMILIQNESFKIGGHKDLVLTHIHLLHACFHQTFFSVSKDCQNIKIVEDFVIFSTKLTSTLLDIIKLYNNDEQIIKAALMFLQGFLELKFIKDNHKKSSDIVTLENALRAILNDIKQQ